MFNIKDIFLKEELTKTNYVHTQPKITFMHAFRTKHLTTVMAQVTGKKDKYCLKLALEKSQSCLKSFNFFRKVPIYLESFRAGIFTLRVSHAIYTPNTSSSPLYAYNPPVHFSRCSE